MKFACKTFFDITATGVTGHYKSSRVPFKDRAGQHIQDEIDWNRARNQQRNWETLTQLISMRTQIFELTHPTEIKNCWHFEFAVETPDVFGTADNPVEILVKDTAGVPMLVNLGNVPDLTPILIVSGTDQNVWFNTLS
jgi:hypothetical protein